MENIVQEEKIIINYDLFVTKFAENEAILEYSLYEQKHNMNITNLAHFTVTDGY